jgi:hypothetical protein
MRGAVVKFEDPKLELTVEQEREERVRLELGTDYRVG